MESARLLYLQHAPSAVVLNAVRREIGNGREQEWLNVECQERFWSEVVNCAAAEQWPVPETHRRRVLRRYIDAVENAGLEVCESFLRAVLAGSSTSARFGFAMHSASAPKSSGASDQAFASYGVAERGSAPLIHCQVASSWRDVGLVPWEAAYVLTEYCVLHPELVAGQRVVELGAGLGLTGLLLARYAAAAEVTLTDYSQGVRTNLQATIQRSAAFLSRPLQARARGNGHAPPLATRRPYRPGRVRVEALDWFDFDPTAVRSMGAGLWLAADVTYAPELCAPLARLLACILGTSSAAEGVRGGAPTGAAGEGPNGGAQGCSAADASGNAFRHVVPFEFETVKGQPSQEEEGGEGGEGEGPARVVAPPPARPCALVACTERNLDTFGLFLTALRTERLQARDISGDVHRELGLVAGAEPQCRLFHYPNGSAVRVIRVDAPAPGEPA